MPMLLKKIRSGFLWLFYVLCVVAVVLVIRHGYDEIQSLESELVIANATNAELTQANAVLTQIMERYERILPQLEENKVLLQERVTLLQKQYTELKRSYEKGLGFNRQFMQNEAVYRDEIDALKQQLADREAELGVVLEERRRRQPNRLRERKPLDDSGVHEKDIFRAPLDPLLMSQSGSIVGLVGLCMNPQGCD